MEQRVTEGGEDRRTANAGPGDPARHPERHPDPAQRQDSAPHSDSAPQPDPAQQPNPAPDPATDARRRIPRTDVLLRDPRLAAAADRLGERLVKGAIRQAQREAREGSVPPERVADTAAALLPAGCGGLRPVVNATGVLLHTNLGQIGRAHV